LKFYVKKVEIDSYNNNNEVYITVTKKHPFITYLRLKYNLDRNDWKNDMYIDDYTAVAYQILVSLKLWNIIKNDIEFNNVPITNYVHINPRYRESAKQLHFKIYK